MLEVNGDEKSLTLTFGPENSPNCWGDNSEIYLTYPSDKITIYHTNASGVKTTYSSGSTIYKKNLGTFTGKAIKVSTSWDDIVVTATGTPVSDSGSSSGHSHSPCSATLKLTAYSITIEVQEKPWGGVWGSPEDKGTYTISGGSTSGSTGSGSSGSGSAGTVSRPWYHLWTVNDNAIRANVAPQCLGDIVTNSTFSGLSVADFSPTSAAPSTNAKPTWKKITSGTGLRKDVMATITADGKSLPGTQNKVDVMVNEISQVEWLTRYQSETRNPGTPTEAHLAKLETYDNGYRTFPEKTEPDKYNSSGVLITKSTIYDKVEVRITLAETIPSGMWGSVYVGWFDPDNPKGSNKIPASGSNKANTVRDNWGGFKSSDNNYCVTFTDADSNYNGFYKAKGFVISPAHAGDNYIIATHPNSGVVDKYCFQSDGKTLLRPDGASTTTLQTSMRSSVLTVWRTLNVELDVAPWPGMPSGISVSLGGIIETQLARACVVTKEFANSTPAPNVGNPMSDADFRKLYGGVGSGSGRDIYGNCKEFWTVRIVLSSNADGSCGVTVLNYNTIIIGYEKIKSLGAYSVGNYAIIVQAVILHEIGHLLEAGTPGPPDHKDSGVMVKQTDPGYILLNPNDGQKYLDEDIKTIQYFSRANN